ncbi:hypothetical protein G6011_03795 [Alternaria panax]|uniref:Uncharacterized protein n=1 Tax=Alternaria panax TaxID=48097 RepID=A0AAD4IFW3_9PLEO|nr:hypothetical protein G6011_03795 [Alternaria panax]
MAQDQPIMVPVSESEAPTICTPSVTSDNTTKDIQKCENSESSTPWPGRTYIIRSYESGQVITFLDGKIVLDKPGGLGTFRWRCVEKKGWLGFRDPASARYLGYYQRGWIRCLVDHHQDWEYICPRKRPEGGYLLLALVKEELVPLGVQTQESENGVEQKVKVVKWDSGDIVWDFIEVSCPST